MSTTQSSDTLPSSVPKLDPSGVNWAIFAEHFQQAVTAKKLWSHFSGTPTCPQSASIATTEESEKITKWEEDKATAHYLLAQKLPDSVLMKFRKYPSVAERWAAIVQEYTSKGMFAHTDLRRRFLTSKCPAKGNVQVFLDGLVTKREELMSLGVEIDDTDMRATVISCLPDYIA
ncbi:hypothetical protein NEOLEDRAFT_1021287, partial [Neolentinus lepideus HHB14362 ss-1]